MTVEYDRLPPNDDLQSCRCLCHHMNRVVTIIRHGVETRYEKDDLGVDVRHSHDRVETWCCQRAIRVYPPPRKRLTV
jgi:hypothetical protein